MNLKDFMEIWLLMTTSQAIEINKIYEFDHHVISTVVQISVETNK